MIPLLLAPTDDEAIRVGGDALTYRELAARASAAAAALEGRRSVAVWATASLHTCAAVAGAIMCGTTVIPLSPRAGLRELEHILGDSGVDCLFASERDELPSVLAGLDRFEVAPSRGQPGAFRELDGEQTALVLYTSGTTGPPKGVQIPRRAIESNLDALGRIWEWSAEDRLVHALPLFHVHGLVLGVIGPLRHGSQLELLPGFSPAALAGALRAGATMVFGVPTMYHRIALEAEEDAELAAAFARARLLVSGSAALSASDFERIKRLTGQSVVERYGMTETLMNISARCAEPRRAGDVGRPVPGVEIRLLDDDGVPLEPGDESMGEIAVRGPNLFTGYLNRPDATAAAFRDGWFLTGDIATRTADGTFRILGRKATDLIKSGGYRIGAGEIEEALLEHPSVAAAAVAGVPDDDLGERVAAWIVLAPGAEATPAELSAHVGALLASHKRPREFHFVDELPRNALGKLMKMALSPGVSRSAPSTS